MVLRLLCILRRRRLLHAAANVCGQHTAFTLPFVHAVLVANTNAAWTPRGDRKLNWSATAVQVAIQNKTEPDGAIA
jgi:hypothetical protein